MVYLGVIIKTSYVILNLVSYTKLEPAYIPFLEIEIYWLFFPSNYQVSKYYAIPWFVDLALIKGYSPVFYFGIILCFLETLIS